MRAIARVFGVSNRSVSQLGKLGKRVHVVLSRMRQRSRERTTTGAARPPPAVIAWDEI